MPFIHTEPCGCKYEVDDVPDDQGHKQNWKQISYCALARNGMRTRGWVQGYADMLSGYDPRRTPSDPLDPWTTGYLEGWQQAASDTLP